MNILIGENYRITSNARNIILNERVEKTDKPGGQGNLTGEHTWRVLGYYPSIERACNHLVTLHINASDARSLVELVEEVQRLRNDLESLTGGLKSEFEGVDEE